MKKLIGVSGNIGSGKTTLAKSLAEKLGFEIYHESVDNNPYLADFYQNMSAWAFHLQFHFLGHRGAQHLLAAASASSSILDRTVYDDGEVFVRVLAGSGSISSRDVVTYQRVFDTLKKQLPAPDLIIFARASIDTLVQRIQSRGRPFEQTITKDYLSLLQDRYDEWVSEIAFCPVITIDTDGVEAADVAENISTKLRSILGHTCAQGELIYGGG